MGLSSGEWIGFGTFGTVVVAAGVVLYGTAIGGYNGASAVVAAPTPVATAEPVATRTEPVVATAEPTLAPATDPAPASPAPERPAESSDEPAVVEVADAGSGAATPEQIAAGKALFTGGAEPACGVCHTMVDAGTEGEIGPNMDELKPSFEQVRAAVTGGVGVMPAYSDSLSADEIEAVARYVASASDG